MDTEYWEKRQTAIEAKTHKKTDAMMKELAVIYKTNIAVSQDKIDAFFARYAEKNMLSLVDAEKILSPIELQDYRARISLSLQKYKETGSAIALADIERLNKQAQVTRLQGLINELEVELGLLANETDILVTEHLTDVAETAYSAVATTMTTIGVGVAFQAIPKDALDFILRYQWSGSQYSDRIWNNKSLLIRSLKETLTIGLVQGTSTQKMARELRGKMNGSFANANRLIRTESNFVLGQASLQVYKDTGLTEYRYYATEDERTCKQCGGLHEKVFKLDDMRVGVNCHPVHPHCRCTTLPVIPDRDW